MNEEKLNQAADDYCYVNLYDGKYCGQDVYEAFQDGMKHTMKLPLADRLTDEERKSIRGLYKFYRDSQKIGFTQYYIGCRALENAFGDDLFKDLFTPKTDTK